MTNTLRIALSNVRDAGTVLAEAGLSVAHNMERGILIDANLAGEVEFSSHTGNLVIQKGDVDILAVELYYFGIRDFNKDVLVWLVAEFCLRRGAGCEK